MKNAISVMAPSGTDPAFQQMIQLLQYVQSLELGELPADRGHVPEVRAENCPDDPHVGTIQARPQKSKVACGPFGCPGS
jgi:hypothetical protein